VRGRGQLITAPVISNESAALTSCDDVDQWVDDGASCAAAAATGFL
jgi:hypothetical protein